jgi:2-polyprenyl-3-methyl-5-hydroxy-6-metoxy-1,4-benzoquinol methylase
MSNDRLVERRYPTIAEPVNGEWIISGVTPEDAHAFLKRHAPWRMELKFEDGPKASDGETYQPFNTRPLNKLGIILKEIPRTFHNAVALDIGFNAGYNSLYLASCLKCNVTGIDVMPKHKEVAERLGDILGVRPEFLIENAETFVRINQYDLALHLGTLYHLANPIKSVENCFRSLKSGGWFALETICYRGSSDATLCKWIYGLGGDNTNFWALGEGAVQSIASYCGITNLKIIFESWPPVYNREMSRVIWIGQKL